MSDPMSSPIEEPGRGRTPRRAADRLRRIVLLAGAGATAGSMALAASAAPAAASGTTPNLSGVTLNFGDQLKEYQTIVDATGALKGAKYKVAWSNFIGGPPIIAAETGGSVDLGYTAETPTIFAQAAGDPVKVVAIAEGLASESPYAVMVPKGSSIKKVSQLKGKSIAIQVGTVEQYVAIKLLQKAGLSYKDVSVENLPITAGETALDNGDVDAASTTQPFIALVGQANKGKVLATGAGTALTLSYIVAAQSALNNPKKAAAIADFVVRLYKSQAILRKDPKLAAQTYVKTYGVPLSVAEDAVKTVSSQPVPVSSTIINYQQQEANTFTRLGLISKTLNVSKIYDTSLNKKIMAAYNKS